MERIRDESGSSRANPIVAALAAADPLLTPARPQVVIIDDHKLFAECIHSALVRSGLQVLALAHTGADGLEAVRSGYPDLVLLDVCLPDGDGLEFATQILECCPETKIIIISALDKLDSRQMFKNGIRGFLSKDTPLDIFVRSVAAVLNDERVAVPESSATPSVRLSPRDRDIELRVSQLTPRERQVLGLLVQGASGGTIAASLTVSPNTVRSHIQNILTKLQVRSRLEAAAFAVRHGIVDSMLGSSSPLEVEDESSLVLSS